jgi:3-isopropylmalate dehydratase
MESVSSFDCTALVSHVTLSFYCSNDFGIRCVIAPSFADIFRNNLMQNGMLPVVLSEEDCRVLAEDAESGLELEVDLEKQEVRRSNGNSPISFTTDPFRRHCLLNGLDDIALTLQKEGAIEVFEQRRTVMWPWLDGFGYQGRKIQVSGTKKMDW